MTRRTYTGRRKISGTTTCKGENCYRLHSFSFSLSLPPSLSLSLILFLSLSLSLCVPLSLSPSLSSSFSLSLPLSLSPSVGEGWINTLNAGPGTTGQIPQRLVNSQVAFGKALRALLVPVNDAVATNIGVDANGSYVLDLTKPAAFNAVMLREDLSQGQRIEAYELDYFDDATKAWVTFPARSRCGAYPTPPATPSGTCSRVLNGTNLVNWCV